MDDLIAKLKQRAIDLEERTGDPMGGTAWMLNAAASALSEERDARVIAETNYSHDVGALESTLRQERDYAEAERKHAADLVQRLIYTRRLAEEARALLDDDKDVKCLKLLGAMAGKAGYRQDVDDTYDLLRTAPPSENAIVPNCIQCAAPPRHDCLDDNCPNRRGLSAFSNGKDSDD